MSARLMVNVNDETADALKLLAQDKGCTVTEIVRRAVSVYDFVSAEHAKGRKFQLVDEAENTVTDLVVLG